MPRRLLSSAGTFPVTATSQRLMKSDATDVMSGCKPASMRRSMPRMKAFAAATYWSSEKRSVTLIGTPARRPAGDRRGHLRGSARNLDEDIGALRLAVQVLGLGKGGFGVVRKQRRDFQRHPAVHATGSIVNRPKEIRRLFDILQRELEEQLLPRFALRELALDRAIVVAAVLDRVVEDRRIRGQPRHRELVDVAAQHARLQQVARDVVEPEALAEIMQDASGLHAVTSVAPPRSSSRVRLLGPQNDAKEADHPLRPAWR